MHIEICVEDASGKIFLEAILPRLLRPEVTWRVHGYRGIGHIPKGLQSTDNAEHRILLDNLPKLIRGCANTPYINALIIVVDSDKKDCSDFLKELKSVHQSVAPTANVVFRLAIEEMEAWLLGDREAIVLAYPNALQSPLDAYVQDSVCGTWETLADAIHPGGSTALIKQGWPAPGIAKCGWAEKISANMNFSSNKSPSFHKLIEALAPYC